MRQNGHNNKNSDLTVFVQGALAASLLWSWGFYFYRNSPISSSGLPSLTGKPRIENSKTKQRDDHLSSASDTNTQMGAHAAECEEDKHTSSFTRMVSERIVTETVRKRMRWPWETLRSKLTPGTNQSKNCDNTSRSNHDPNSQMKMGQTDEQKDAALFSQRNESARFVNTAHHHDSSFAPLNNQDGGNQDGEEKEKLVCIGSIFGLDVGGTLAKLVYFEKDGSSVSPTSSNKPKKKHDDHGLFQSFAEARTLDMAGDNANNQSAKTMPSSRSSNPELNNHSHYRDAHDKPNIIDQRDGGTSETNLRNLYSMKQVSVPHIPSISKKLSFPLPSRGNDEKQEQKKLKRSRSMFNLSAQRAEALDRFYNFIQKLDSYEKSAKDRNLSFHSRSAGGHFHFIKFETRHMQDAMDLVKSHKLHWSIRKMGATGGGAHKYAADWERQLNILMVKQEELDSLVVGMQFILSDVVGECYTFQPYSDNNQSHYFGKHQKENTANDSKKNNPLTTEDPESYIPKKFDIRSWSRKVKRDVAADKDSYPYMLVTIGTGVSLLRVDGPRKYERVSGSTIGGGTYWGLCRLLTDVETFEDVMKLAEQGDPSKVDMMVGDIYGNDSEALEKLGLPANIVASSFGKLVSKQEPAFGLKQEDLARALLFMVTNNIGQVAYLNAQLHKTKRIYFVGNFLRSNTLSQQRLSYAINFWSQGKMEALFLEHEGYFGALGAFLLSQEDTDGNQMKLQHKSIDFQTRKRFNTSKNRQKPIELRKRSLSH